jgi:alpha-D-ribose 1-methylphosphonate 5-triphosphate synthase subunit PhnL
MSRPGIADLRLHSVTKAFTVHRTGRVIVGLQEATLTITRGEHVTLVGPSGAGKTTLLRCIYGTYRPTQGQVLLTDSAGNTHDLTAASPAELAQLRSRYLGYATQFLTPEPRRDPLTTVSAAARRRGLSRGAAAAAARRALAELEVDEQVWEVPVSLLSGGEKQRVNLAKTVVVAPPLLLLDEPTASLDPANAQLVMKLITSLVDSGTTVISVLHNLHDPDPGISRIVTLSDHRIQNLHKKSQLP